MLFRFSEERKRSTRSSNSLLCVGDDNDELISQSFLN